MRRLSQIIEEGLAHFRIGYDGHSLSQICTYVESLEEWNRRMNLVGLKETQAIVQELIYDAFFLFTCVGDRVRILDLGSGAGILAVPMAVLGRDKAVFSVDKSLRKVQFQRHARRLLGLKNLSIFHSRSEDLEPLGVDIVMAKAFGAASEAIRKGARHLREGGSILLVRGKSEEPKKEEGFASPEMREYRLPKSNKEYRLFVYKKVP